MPSSTSFEKADHAVQGSPQLVGGVGQKFTLSSVRLLCLPPGFFRLSPCLLQLALLIHQIGVSLLQLDEPGRGFRQTELAWAMAVPT
jgi:16S rRNA C1402 N4-methylase RsmH